MASIMSTPRTVDIALTGRCNLKCEYCFYADEMVALSDLPTERWLDVFEELGRLGVMDVTLTGGEAFARPDFFDLLDGVIANHMRYTILSNGTLITDKTLSKFEIGKRRQRMNYIQISIDGSTAEIHNISRPKSFDRAIRGVRLLKEAGFPVTVRVTVNRHNLYDLENIAYLLLEDIGLPSFGTNDAAPLGKGYTHNDKIALTTVQRLEAMKIFERLLERYPGRLNAQAGPQALIRMYSEMEHAHLTGEKAPHYKMGYLSGCGCIFMSLAFLHDGTIVPCHMLPEQKLGNVLTDSIEEIWASHPILQSMRARRDIPMQEVPGCEQCQWASYCTGNCPGIAYKLTRDLNQASPVDCYRRFIAETGQRYRLPLIETGIHHD